MGVGLSFIAYPHVGIMMRMTFLAGMEVFKKIAPVKGKSAVTPDLLHVDALVIHHPGRWLAIRIKNEGIKHHPIDPEPVQGPEIFYLNHKIKKGPTGDPFP